MNEQQVTDEETGLPVIIPGQKPPAEETPKNLDEEKNRSRSRMRHRAQQSQPLATRHLDPNFNPALEEAGANYANKTRVKLRSGFTFYVGEKLAYKGPAILYLTEEQMKGQEHKIEVLGDKPVKMLDSTPVAVKADMTALERAKKIETLKAELEVLTKEHEEYVKTTTAEAEASKDTVKEPDFNPEAERAETKPPEPGQISGPAVAGNGDKKGPGRPAGKVSQIGKK
jgi:hypothetical protein